MRTIGRKFPHMSRTVNLELLTIWLMRHGGVSELERRSKVSRHTINRIKNRRNPAAPKKESTQLLLAEAVGVGVNDLFPLVGASGERAS
jgi:transcriptional regulator with XRE-family HTH domain